jgi:hypothetical protein
MPDTLDLTIAVAAALAQFRFSGYGLDEVDEIMRDPDLDLHRGLTKHLVEAIQKELDYT